jgi:ferritin-like metal-binding protein YciE
MKRRLEEHLDETMSQADRLRTRLDALDETGSLRKQAMALVGAMPKGLLDFVRGDKQGKKTRAGYITESLEIAAYQLPSRLAARAGNEETAAVARENLAEEERMRDFLDGAGSDVDDDAPGRAHRGLI